MDQKNWRMRLLIGLLTVLVFAGTIASVLRFHDILEADEYELQKESLLDMAKLEATVLEVKLEGYINTLHAVAELLHQGELYTEGHMEHLRDLTEDGRFYRLGLITPDGILHSDMGEVDVSDRDYFQGILRGESFLTGIIDSRLTGERVVVMAVPVYDEQGGLRGAVHGLVLLDEFEPYTGTSLAVGNTDTYIFDRSGAYIVKNNQAGASWGHDNIFDHLEQADGGIPIDELHAAIQEGRSVTTEVVSGGVTYLGCFLPIRNGEWYALVAVPTAEIRAHVSAVLDYDFYRMLAIIGLLVGSLCAVILIWNHRRDTWERRREIELRERLMAQVVGFMVADLDEEKILSRSGRGLLREDQNIQSYPEYIESIVATGARPEDQKAILQFFSPEEIRADAAAGFQERTREFLFRYMAGGESVWLECESRLDRDRTNGHLIVAHVLRDIHSRKEEELTLRTEAERDMLTGLYNRSAGARMIDRCLSASAGRDAHALVLLDLDNFKTLNDTLGHQWGDQALKDVAEILTAHFRKDDVVCRLGGDEFVVFLKGVTPPLVREKLAALLEKLRLEYEEGGKSVCVAASAGVTFTGAGDDFAALYKRADQVLYQAKRGGKSTFREHS